MTDRQLLADYAQTASGDAFGEIVRRHSGMVYQACRRVLGDEHGAEDAAQATFLLLARKARKLPEKTVLSGWLFRAAQNSAMHLRREHARRTRREKEAAVVKQGDGASREELWVIVEPEITGAIAALPPRQRDAVVLRYVTGKAPVEAAREMNCSLNTFSVSLSKAMAKLRRKFSGRQALPAGAIAALLAANAPLAAPQALTASITAACLGTASASASALSIAKGVAGAMAWAKVKLVTITIAVATAVAGAGGTVLHRLAARAPSAFPVKLIADPEVSRILESLDAGQSAYLPPIRTAGDINEVARKYGLDRTGPRGRNYTVKMVWMANRKRAIYAGANHARPHRLNDVWEYDLPSNTWVCLYGPDDLGSGGSAWSGVRNEAGVLRTARGGPAIIGNGEWQTTYVPELKAMIFHSNWSIYGKKKRAKYISKSEHQPALWQFSPSKREWQPIRCRDPKPRGGPAIYLDYIGSIGRMAWISTRSRSPGMWLYDPVENDFEKLFSGDSFKPRNNPHVPPSDGVAVYCRDRDVLVVCSRDKAGGVTVHYDVKSRKWLKTSSGPGTPPGHMSFTPCGYDTVGRMVLLYDQKSTIFWSYSPEQMKWSKIAPIAGPPPPSGRSKVFGYYDEARNVFVLCQNEKVWGYRHRRRR
jgi:RNA polymerase sigma factor (sigma-70 family)